MSLMDKIKTETKKVAKSIELSIDELMKLEPNKIGDAVDDFERELDSLKDRLIALDQEKEDVKQQIKAHKEKRKELIKRLKKKDRG